MASSKIFSLEGKGLKLDTAADLEPHIAALRAMNDVEEVRILGNTLGVGACKLLGEVLAAKKTLRVSSPRIPWRSAKTPRVEEECSPKRIAFRLPTLPISLPVVSSTRFPRLFHHSLHRS
jgi:hypothetical protein